MNPLIKILLGFGIGIAIFMLTPIADLLELFLAVFILPMVFLISMGVGLEGGYEAFRGAWDGSLKRGLYRLGGDLKERLTTYREQAGATVPTAAAGADAPVA